MVNHNLGIVGECALKGNKPLKQIKADHLTVANNCMRFTNETYIQKCSYYIRWISMYVIII